MRLMRESFLFVLLERERERERERQTDRKDGVGVIAWADSLLGKKSQKEQFMKRI